MCLRTCAFTRVESPSASRHTHTWNDTNADTSGIQRLLSVSPRPICLNPCLSGHRKAVFLVEILRTKCYTTRFAHSFNKMNNVKTKALERQLSSGESAVDVESCTKRHFPQVFSLFALVRHRWKAHRFLPGEQHVFVNWSCNSRFEMFFEKCIKVSLNSLTRLSCQMLQ